MKSDLLRGLLYLVAHLFFSFSVFYSPIPVFTFQRTECEQGVCVTVCDLDYHERVRSFVSLCVSGVALEPRQVMQNGP